jgi:hypothetical protein
MYTYGYPFQQQQPMTDIGQVSNEQEAVNAYVAAGRSKIMFSADDQTVFVKCVSMNGQTSMDIFDRRAPAPVPAPPEYVTREELNAALEALKSPKKAVKTEVSE